MNLRASDQGGWARRRLPIGALLGGVLCTALVAGGLAFARVQVTGYQRRLDLIDQQLSRPLNLLDQAQATYRQSQATFSAATASAAAGQQNASTQQTAAGMQEALSQAEQANRLWAEFKANPVRFPGEQAARSATDSAIAATKVTGERLGVAALSPTADPAAVAQLEKAQRDASDGLFDTFEHLQSDFYKPTLTAAIVSLRNQAGSSAGTALTAMLVVILAGLTLTLFGSWKALRVQRSSSAARAVQDQAAAENALDAKLQHALDMTDTEDHVYRVIERALTEPGPEPSVDFLLAVSSVAPFEHALSPTRDPAQRCPVSSPNECPVTRHGQSLVFDDSGALDACPFLVDRESVPAAAVCTPVSVAGRTTGVLHQAYLGTGSVPAHRVRQLEIVARKAGERLGMLRAFERSETEAQTDPLTGLLNRRSLEAAVDQLQRQNVHYTVAYADLDHFKVLNDTHGHEAGDRALRLFCTVLRTNVRPEDIVARYGGEEFVVVLPRCRPDDAVPVLERVQGALADTLRADAAPPFTVSIGVASDHLGGTFEEILFVADGCLLHAKDQGRNRIVVAGQADVVDQGPVRPTGTVSD